MDDFTCDICGKVLLADENTRYIVKIEVFAAYDPLELTRQDIEGDHEAEMARLLAQMRNMSTEQLEDQVYRSFRFDLCPSCQAKYLAQPLPGKSDSQSPS